MGDGKDNEDVNFDVLNLGEIQMPEVIWNLGVEFRGKVRADRKFGYSQHRDDS